MQHAHVTLILKNIILKRLKICHTMHTITIQLLRNQSLIYFKWFSALDRQLGILSDSYLK